MGLAGSDVLARFGAVRGPAAAAGALVLPGPEDAPLTRVESLQRDHGGLRRSY